MHRRVRLEAGLRYIEPAVVRLPGTAVAVTHALHPLHALVLLFLHLEAVHPHLHGPRPLRHVALMAVQTVGLALEQGLAVLQEAERHQGRCRKYQCAVVSLQPQQTVLRVRQQLAAQKAEAHAVRFLERIPQRLVFVIVSDVFLELIQRHALQHAVRQIHLTGALLAQGHILHLGGQQPRGRAAADGAELFIVTE